MSESQPQDQQSSKPLGPGFLGWFIGTLSAMVFISVFYVGDLISTGLHYMFVYNNIAQQIDSAQRPDLALSPPILARLPTEQAGVLQRAATIYGLLHKGEMVRAQEMLLTPSVPETPAKYKLSAVLTWADDNRLSAMEHRQERAKAETRRREIITQFGEHITEELVDDSHETETTLASDCEECETVLSPEQAARVEYLALAGEIENREQLILQSAERDAELRRMALERARELLKDLSRPVFDSHTLTAYREVSAYAARLGYPMPDPSV